MVAREVGSRLLESGVEVSGDDLQRIARRFPEEVTRSIRKARVDDQDTTVDMDLFSSLSQHRVLLSIVIEK